MEGLGRPPHSSRGGTPATTQGQSGTRSSGLSWVGAEPVNHPPQERSPGPHHLARVVEEADQGL